LEKIASLTGAPLVLHGGSGIHPDDIRQARQMNVVKVNIGADLFRAWVSGLQEGAALQVTGHEPPHHGMMTHASGKVTELARKKLSLMGAPGHAKALQQRLEEAGTDLPARARS
jgi:fructose-bisphosphate aldolase, class II